MPNDTKKPGQNDQQDPQKSREQQDPSRKDPSKEDKDAGRQW